MAENQTVLRDCAGRRQDTGLAGKLIQSVRYLVKTKNQAAIPEFLRIMLAPFEDDPTCIVYEVVLGECYPWVQPRNTYEEALVRERFLLGELNLGQEASDG